MTIKQEDFKWSSLLRSEHYLQPCPKMCGHPSAVIFQLIIPATHIHLRPMKELPAVDGQKCLVFITLILSQCADSFASVSHQHENWDAESALWLWFCLTTHLSFPALLLPPPVINMLTQHLGSTKLLFVVQLELQGYLDVPLDLGVIGHYVET